MNIHRRKNELVCNMGVEYMSTILCNCMEDDNMGSMQPILERCKKKHDFFKWEITEPFSTWVVGLTMLGIILYTLHVIWGVR